MRKQLPNKSREHWLVENCAEVDALNKAFKARPGARMRDMKSVTINIGTQSKLPKNAPPCNNCKKTTRNSSVETYMYENCNF